MGLGFRNFGFLSLWLISSCVSAVTQTQQSLASSHLKIPINDYRVVALGGNTHPYGWHAFRRTVATTLLRRGESAKLVSGILGNSVEILLKSYDLPEFENFRAPLAQVAGTLLPNVTNLASAA